MPKVFISHASKDEKLVDEFFDLLQLGCNLGHDDIFCTSIEGADIRIGEDFVQWIEENLDESDLVVLLVTANYLDSKFCLAEMGAAWALGKNVFPIVTPDQERDIGAVMTRTQTAVLDSTGLDDLRDQIIEHHSSVGHSTGRWISKKEDFMNELPDILEDLPEPDSVSQQRFEAERKKAQGAKEIYKELQDKNERLEKRIDMLEEAKDAEEVSRIKSQTIPERDRYDEMVESVKDDLDDLTSVEVRCIFAEIHGEPWVPEDYTWRSERPSIEKAEQSEWIKDVGRHDTQAFKANRKHPKYSSIFEKIEELKRFLEDNMSSDTRHSLQEEKELMLNITNRQFWEEELTTWSLLD